MYMESRVDKYSSNDVSSRSTRNAKLYREVYGKYDSFDNLPLEDNTDEIDMNRLQEILHDDKKEIRREDNHRYNVLEQRKRNIDEQRVYDINQILQKAKYENSKLKETASLPKVDTSILSTLQNRNVRVDEVVEIKEEYQEKKKNVEEELSMTRELKFKNLSEEVLNDPLIEHVMPDNDLSLDLFDNLKPTGDTITTKPIRDTVEIKKVNQEDGLPDKIDVHSGDTRDIDIIKNTKNEENGNDFFTSSYEFSDNDFFDDMEPKKTGVFKIILLFLTIIVFAGVIAYFVITYGFGA